MIDTSERDHIGEVSTEPGARSSGPTAISRNLWLIGVGLAAIAAAGLVQSILMTQLIEELRSSSADSDFEAWQARVELYNLIFPGITVVGYGLVALAMARLGASGVRGARLLGLVGCASAALMLMESGFYMIGSLLEQETYASLATLTQSDDYIIARALVAGLGFASLLLLLGRLGAARGRPLAAGLLGLAWLWIGWELLFPVVTAMTGADVEMMSGSLWGYVALMRGSWCAGVGLFVFLALRLGTAVGRSERGVEGAWRPEEPAAAGRWAAAAAGLDLYASTLVWRIFASVVVGMLLFLGVISGSAGLTKLATLGLPLIAVVTAIVMAVGVMRYARQPDSSPAVSSAWFSGALMSLGVLMECYGLILVLRILAPDDLSYGVLMETAERARSLPVWSLGVTCISLLALLVSFVQLGRHLGQDRLVGRVMKTGTVLAIVSALVLVLRWYGAEAAARGNSMLPLLGLVVLAGSLMAVVMYVGLIRDAAEAIRERQGDAELPAARAV